MGRGTGTGGPAGGGVVRDAERVERLRARRTHPPHCAPFVSHVRMCPRDAPRSTSRARRLFTLSGAPAVRHAAGARARTYVGLGHDLEVVRRCRVDVAEHDQLVVLRALSVGRRCSWTASADLEDDVEAALGGDAAEDARGQHRRHAARALAVDHRARVQAVHRDEQEKKTWRAKRRKRRRQFRRAEHPSRNFRSRSPPQSCTCTVLTGTSSFPADSDAVRKCLLECST